MTLAAGDMDRRVILQQAREDRGTRGESTTVWPAEALSDDDAKRSGQRNVKVWARAKPVKTDETFASAQMRGVEVMDFTIRYVTDVTTAWRILAYGAKPYDILSIVEVGRRDGLTLRCVNGLRG